jgi:hypothetical protein
MGHHPIRERFDELVALIADESACGGRGVVSAQQQGAAKLRLADAA